MSATMITFLAFVDKFLSTDKLIPLVVAVIAVVFLMSALRRRMRQQEQRSSRSSHSSPQREPPTATPKEQLRRDLEKLIVELQELSRRISAEIDTRFAKLEVSIRDADRRIAVLNRLNRQLTDKKSPSADGGKSDDLEVRHGIIYELADAGLTPIEIAKDTGKTPGEVELILSLRRPPDSKSTSKI